MTERNIMAAGLRVLGVYASASALRAMSDAGSLFADLAEHDWLRVAATLLTVALLAGLGVFIFLRAGRFAADSFDETPPPEADDKRIDPEWYTWVFMIVGGITAINTLSNRCESTIRRIVAVSESAPAVGYCIEHFMESMGLSLLASAALWLAAGPLGQWARRRTLIAGDAAGAHLRRVSAYRCLAVGTGALAFVLSMDPLGQGMESMLSGAITLGGAPGASAFAKTAVFLLIVLCYWSVTGALFRRRDAYPPPARRAGASGDKRGQAGKPEDARTDD